MTGQHDSSPSRAATDRDLAARWLTSLLVWGVPIAAILASAYGNIAVRWVWPAAFAFMGGACALNARRCRRRHCYFTAPLLFLAALLSALHGWRVVPLGPAGYQWIVNGAFVGVVLLGWLPELLFGRYLRPRGEDRSDAQEGEAVLGPEGGDP